MDENKLNFWTGANYLKRDESCDSEDIALTAFGTSTKPIDHNLGYIPFIEVHAELDGDGFVWAGDKIDQYTETSLTGYSQPNPKLTYWTTINTLTVNLLNDTASTATRTIYWLIYKDYRDS